MCKNPVSLSPAPARVAGLRPRRILAATAAWSMLVWALVAPRLVLAEPPAEAPTTNQAPVEQAPARISATPSVARAQATIAPRASTAPAAPFRWSGEEFYYSVRLNGAEAMRASVRAGDVRMLNNQPYVPISGTAQSTGFFHSIYPLDDRANTFFDPASYLPLRSEKNFNEKGVVRRYKVDYRHDRYEARVERARADKSSSNSAPIPPGTHDMFTWTYALRSQGKLELGQKMSYYVFDGWLLSRIDVRVVGREDVYTPMGWFKAWKLDFTRVIMGAQRGKRQRGKPGPVEPAVHVREPARHTGSFWLSRDENLLPIKLSISTVLGVGEVVLIRYKPAEARPH